MTTERLSKVEATTAILDGRAAELRLRGARVLADAISWRMDCVRHAAACESAQGEAAQAGQAAQINGIEVPHALDMDSPAIGTGPSAVSFRKAMEVLEAGHRGDLLEIFARIGGGDAKKSQWKNLTHKIRHTRLRSHSERDEELDMEFSWPAKLGGSDCWIPGDLASRLLKDTDNFKLIETREPSESNRCSIVHDLSGDTHARP